MGLFPTAHHPIQSILYPTPNVLTLQHAKNTPSRLLHKLKLKIPDPEPLHITTTQTHTENLKGLQVEDTEEEKETYIKHIKRHSPSFYNKTKLNQ